MRTEALLAQIDHVLDDDPTSADAMRWVPDADQAGQLVPLVPRAATVQIVVNLAPVVKRYVAAYRRLAARLGRWLHSHKVASLPPAEAHRHRRRCDLCSPFANPRPLSIDGHAYHRKTRARRRRKS